MGGTWFGTAAYGGDCPVLNPVCGNGNMESGEQCDDGNIVNGDGCDSTCKIESTSDPICGNGVMEDDEACDDGNVINGDGCSSTCEITTECSDGIDNDDDGTIDCNPGNEDPGCYPDGNGDGGECDPTDESEDNEACLDFAKTTTASVGLGSGNTATYILQYSSSSSTNPLPNIGIIVEGSRGRDNQNKGFSYVRPFETSFDNVDDVWTYTFVWEAADSTGTVTNTLTAGTFNVKAYENVLDLSSEITQSSSCIDDTITVEDTGVIDPNFVITKDAIANSCSVDGDAVITYRVSVTNVSSVTGSIDFLEDRYDSKLLSIGVTPSSINPTGGLSGGVITWEEVVLMLEKLKFIHIL
ncbi:MAG: DUF4215 domain-containing protein [Candidatus Dojkabacteria bacterium]|nr:DUF4215 domain-containing protein [Candidatus Dojkabacteria bacterium]